MEESCSSSFYRAPDSITNFKIRVSLEKLEANLSDITFNESSDNNGNKKVEERVFSWQEKVFSRREIEKYSSREEFATALDQKYQEDISKLKSSKSELLNHHRLFTYVDCDHFLDGKRSGLMTKISPLGSSDILRNVAVSTKGHYDNTNSTLTMCIMADLSLTGSTPTEEDEIMLCILKFQNNIIFSIKPDFSWKGKFYTVLSKGREIYQYALSHASKQLSREEQERGHIMYKEIYTKHNDILQAYVGSEFERPPSEYLRLFVNGEITSARHFEYGHLFMSWFVDLPEGWTAGSLQSLFGVTQTCSGNKEGTAHFSEPFTLDLVYKEKLGSMNWPQLFVEVLSVDSWSRYRSEGYGYITIPFYPGPLLHRVTCWRPQGKGLLSELKRYFMGNCTELKDLSYVAIPSNFQTRHLNKFGFKTISTGEVVIKTQTIFQSMSPTKYLGNTEISAKRGNSSSITNILDSLQRAKQRLRTARENLKDVLEPKKVNT